jgi:hypothetical protein
VTLHRKEQVLGPLVEQGLGARLTVVGDVDTDALGTFTRDVPRPGTQLDAARRKAQLAIERTGLPLGLGSEGSFGAGPLGFGSWNLELVVLVDATRGIEVVGAAQGPGLHASARLGTRTELAEFATLAKFPEHGLVVRPEDEDDPRLRKGIRTWPELEDAFDWALGSSASGHVFVESDLRAHQHPRRMAMIERAGRDLVERLGSPCSACQAPGFGLVGIVPGLPCAECGMPTREPIADEFGCVRCDHREQRERPGPATASPARCDWCNP